MTEESRNNINLNNKFLTVHEFAQMLKYSDKTIYSWISYKQISKDLYYKIGSKILFDCDKVFTWIQNGGKIAKRTVNQKPK